MVDLRRCIGITQIALGIVLIIITTYLSNVFAVSHIQFTKDAAAHLQALNRLGTGSENSVPDYATIHTNYILLSNLSILLLLNFGISAIVILLACMMILQGIVNKFAIPKLSIGYKPLLWLGLLGFATVFIVLIITQYFVRYYFS